MQYVTCAQRCHHCAAIGQRQHFRPLLGGLLFIEARLFISSAVYPGLTHAFLHCSPDSSPPWLINFQLLSEASQILRPSSPGIRACISWGMLQGNLWLTTRNILDQPHVLFHILKSTAAASCCTDQTVPHPFAPLLIPFFISSNHPYIPVLWLHTASVWRVE